MIRLGVCTAADNIDRAARGGCDYIELGFAAVADMTEAEYGRALSLVRNGSIGVEAMNGFIPGRYRITGPEADIAPIQEFLRGGLARAREMGVKVIVFGSSGARKMPEGFTDKAKAEEQCAQFLRMAGPMAESFGMRIAIEPLCYREDNVINTVSDAVRLARNVSLPSVGVLADYYHMLYNKEGVGGIAEAGALLWHCHIARGDTRTVPARGDGEDYKAFFDALRAIGYNGRVSVEGRINDFDAEIGPGIALMRELCG
ncbi:MAG: sugar phosphate isomerase/epimerase [Clostridiales bacterium]|nr:sugar phosphate isomerase/epimerase [Clostridiales bacterium]